MASGITHTLRNERLPVETFPLKKFELHLPAEPDVQTQHLLKKLNGEINLTTGGEYPLFSQIKKIETIKIDGPDGHIPCRLYTPHAQEPLPVFVFFHGGGWVSGDLGEYDYFCQQICLQTPALVVSVDYRLAPLHKFPKPLEDCYAATEWVAGHIDRYGGDPKRLAVGGDSAGGNLAAAVTLMARDKQAFKIHYQVLIFPALNHQFDTASYTSFAEGYFLTKSLMQDFWGSYLNTDKDGLSPYASPLKAERLSGLPPAYVVLANFDVLFSEGVAYASALRSEGISTELQCYPTIHAFINFEKELDVADEAMKQIALRLKQNL